MQARAPAAEKLPGAQLAHAMAAEVGGCEGLAMPKVPAGQLSAQLVAPGALLKKAVGHNWQPAAALVAFATVPKLPAAHGVQAGDPGAAL